MSLSLSIGARNLAVCTSCRLTSLLSSQRHNSNRAAVTRTNRHNYAKTYPTLLVFPDGSTINIRYKEPRKIIRLPLDLSTLSEAERIAKISKRKPKPKLVIEEEIEDTFDLNKYSHMWKKK